MNESSYEYLMAQIVRELVRLVTGYKPPGDQSFSDTLSWLRAQPPLQDVIEGGWKYNGPA